MIAKSVSFKKGRDMTAATSFGKRGVARPAPAQSFARAPAAAPPVDVEAPGAALPSWLSRVPFATLFILAVLVAVFMAEAGHASDAGPGLVFSHRTLIAMGGLSRDLVSGQGQWWRLFTAPLLHGSIGHIVGNALVLLLVGYLLEPLIGSAWFAALFVVGAFGGAWASLFMNPAGIVTVGASGAIMALLSATFVCSFHDEAGGVAKRMRYLSLRLIIPSLLPSLASAASHTDFSAHTGGAVAGAAMGFALMILWPEDAPRPAFKPVAYAIAALGISLAAVAFWMAMHATTAIAERDIGLIPQNEIPRETQEDIAASADLVTRYPHDPRGHLFRAMHFLQIRDVPDAGDQLRIALDGLPAVKDEISPKVEPSVRIMLALTLVARGRQQEAVGIAQPACAFATADQHFADALANLQKAGVCN
jgi:rhomboid protease GluP